MSDPAASTVDAGEVPYYIWPPFPTPPEGVKIISFKEFKPKGIIVSADSDEEDEVDGDGVKTVRLDVDHVGPEEKAARDRAKRARRRRKGASGADAGTAVAGGYNPKGDMKQYWHEIWAETEKMRRATPVDTRMDLSERFSQIMVDFLTGRTIPIRGLQSIFDHFRVFTGLIEKTAQGSKTIGPTKEGKNSKDQDDMSDEVEYSDDDKDEEEEEEVAKDSGLSAVEITGQEDQMLSFLENPERQIAIFLSSFYRDRGMAWDPEKLRDGPILIQFILEFIIRHRTMPEIEKGLRKALVIVEQAKIELPATKRIAETFPEPFGYACMEVFGNKSTMGIDFSWEKPNILEPSQVVELIPDEKDIVRDAMDVEVNGKPLETDAAVKAAMDLAGWGDANEGNASTETGDWGADVGGWGEELIDESAQPAPTWGELPTHTLARWFGPTTLPMSHIVARVEQSARVILGIEPPLATSPSQFRAPMGVLILGPSQKTSTHELSTVRPPWMMFEDLDPCVQLKPYDPSLDTIRVLVDPSILPTFEGKERMEMIGVWIQVVERKQESPESGSGSKKKKKSKSSAADSSKEFWYCEKTLQIMPSFWIEHE
ncbi:hypothetical protein FRC02_009162 [Tulasnella sp. 418]|nr:hypothetical protein FRC02_009162 [Tulasnella sp. 418]